MEAGKAWDGIYTLDDLPDAAELIRVRRENENRAAEAARGERRVPMVVVCL
jgi:hypothetical protein